MTLVKLLCLLTLLSSCAGSVLGRAPETRTLDFPSSPPLVYGQAAQVLRQMGTQITATDGQHHLDGLLKGLIVVAVAIAPHGAGTRLDVTMSIPPGTVTVGTFTALEEFCTRLTALESVHGR